MRMTNERITLLKSIAEEISTAPSKEEQIALLTQGFELFSEETERLDEAYGGLRKQFRAVNQKLEDTNARLSNKVQELHVLTSYLDNILIHMSEGLLFIDLEGNITTYNHVAEELLEKKRSDLLFQPFSNFFEDGVFGYSMEEALKGKKTTKTTYASLHFPDGRQKDLEIDNTFIPEKSPESKGLDYTEGLIIILRDITEFRRLQMLASRNDRMQALGEMAAQVAHEIRNPLGGIKGFASLLRRDLQNSPEQLRLTEYILEGTNTLERLVTQVLNYSRPLHLELEKVSLSNIILELKESLSAEGLLSSVIDFEFIPEPKIFAPLDVGLFKSALRNLLMNALQAMPKGGKLTVRISEDSGKALLDVEDTGVGIAEEHLKKIFSPFFSTKADGNGLGLAEAHKVVQAHGGDISVESALEKGTIIHIKIPIKT